MISPAILAAAVLAVAAAPETQVQTQTPAPGPQDPTAIPDVVVEGRTLREFTRDFVAEVGAPPRRRGLARWDRRVCVGVVNLQFDAAQYLADRVSTVAEALGVEAREPGCDPNIVVVFTEDGAAMAQALVGENRRAFRMGIGGVDRGNVGLRQFQEEGDTAVRWWHVSLPVHEDTGLIAVRLPGGGIPIIKILGSRLNNEIEDRLNKAMIIVDVDELEGTTFAQLSDYIAFVALAQVDPEAETAAYDTILNLFQDPAAPQALTDWDMAYLTALYSTHSRRINPGAQANDVARLLERDQRQPAPATPPPVQPPPPETD